MSGAIVVARRELSGLFTAPFTWILLVVVALMQGLVFNLFLAASGGSVTDSLQGAMSGPMFWTWLVFLPSLLAMRLIAEESRSGTLEYLLTAPVSDAAVVTGKFIAATAFLALLWTTSLCYAGAMAAVGGRPDWPAAIATYLGTVLASGLFVALGLLASTFTSTPLLAAFLAMVACVLWLALPTLANEAVGYVAPLIAAEEPGRAAIRDAVRSVVDNMDAAAHFQRSFRVGVLDSAEVVFFLTWTALFLFMTARSLEARRWRV